MKNFKLYRKVIIGVLVILIIIIFYQYHLQSLKQEAEKSRGSILLSSLCKQVSKDGSIPLYGANYSTSPLAIGSFEFSFVDQLIKIAKSEPREAEKSSGYTKYGAFFGDAYGEWCTEFALWSVIQAQNQLDVRYLNVYYPDSSWSGGCISWYRNRNLFYLRDDYIPRRGDMIFFEYDGDGITDHTGLVTGVEYDKKEDQLYILTIEGNLPEDYPVGSIVERRLEASWDKIYGYGTF